jgi:pseudaminic acid synthase
MSTFIIAELSGNHRQSLKIARDSIHAIADTGADAVKLQTYTADTITIDHDGPEFLAATKGTIWEGRTLYDLYREAFTPWEWHAELKELAESLGLIFFSSPFDPIAVDFLEQLGSAMYKIASFEITDIPLIEYVAKKQKPVIISTGIASAGDIQAAIDACRRSGNNEITLLQCTSSYPAPVELANLRMIPSLANTFGVKSGLSDHTPGSTVAIAGVALGAVMVEKHFILNRELGGPDAEFSMEPHEFKEMVNAIRVTEKALGEIDYSLTEKKRKSRAFSRSLFVVEDVQAGHVLTSKNIRSIRPGNGLAPVYLPEIIGKRSTRTLKRGEALSWDMFT